MFYVLRNSGIDWMLVGLNTIRIIALALSFFFHFVAPAVALPACPNSVNEVWTNCSGSFKFPDGEGTYNQPLKGGKGRDRQGNKSFADGATYVGEWKDDAAHGQGSVTFLNGAKYIGQFREGLAHGLGTFTSSDGGKYVGEWKDDFHNGKGTMTYPGGGTYVGEWKDGVFHGQGSMQYADGSKYVGEWKNGVFHGQGTNIFANGSTYVGEWKDGVFHGQGSMQYADDSKYVGEWKNGVFHGQGTNIFANGSTYVGGFKDGVLHGLGFLLFPNGTAKACRFIEGNSQSCLGSLNIDVAPILKTAFISLSHQMRTEIQNNLNIKGGYDLTIDGIWGSNTLLALASFSVFELRTIDVHNRASADKLMAAILGATPAPLPEPYSASENRSFKVASGTGFYVSSAGHVITNEHVINGCSDIKIHSRGAVYPTKIIAEDPQNDLALLKSEITPDAFFALSEASPYPLQDIVVAGHPFGERVSSTLKFTQGIISAISGLGNNYSRIQIDAALQPGNSGGPIIDEFGNVVAVAVAKLDLKKILDDYGVIPENTNFGIKASAVRNLMEGNGLSLQPPNKKVLSKADLSRLATDGTVFLSCWMTTAQIEQLKLQKVMFDHFD